MMDPFADISDEQRADFRRAKEGLEELKAINLATPTSEKSVEQRVIWPILRSIGLNTITRVKMEDSFSQKKPDYTVFTSDDFSEEHCRIEAKALTEGNSTGIEKLYKLTQIPAACTNSKSAFLQIVESIKYKKRKGWTKEDKERNRHRMVLVTNGRFWVGIIVHIYPTFWKYEKAKTKKDRRYDVKRRIFLRVDIEKDAHAHEMLWALHPDRPALLNALLKTSYWEYTNSIKTKQEDQFMSSDFGDDEDWRSTCKRLEAGGDRSTQKPPATRRATRKLGQRQKNRDGSTDTDLLIRALKSKLAPGFTLNEFVKPKWHHIDLSGVTVARVQQQSDKLKCRLYSRAIIGGNADPSRISWEGEYKDEPTETIVVKRERDLNQFLKHLKKEWPEGDKKQTRKWAKKLNYHQLSAHLKTLGK